MAMYLILLYSWEPGKQCSVDRVRIRHLVVEESGIESESAREVSSLNIYHTGMYLTLLCSREGAEHCPVDRIGIGCLAVEESGVESESARESPSPYS